MKRLGLVLLLAVAIAGCKKKPSEQQNYVADMTDLCNAEARSGAKTAAESAAWMDKRARSKRFRQQLSEMGAKERGDKAAALEAMAREAGILDCPFLNLWKKSDKPPTLSPLEAADRCEQARSLYLKHVTRRSAEAVEAALDTDRPRLEADAMETQERIKLQFLDACHSLGEFDLACFEDPGSQDPQCQNVMTRLGAALAPKTK